MCLLMLAWRSHTRYRLVVAANRDEYHARAAAPLAPWPPPDELIAGRDLRAQGAWLGIDRARRFGVVTNFRELQRTLPGAPSRGDLIPRYLRSSAGGRGSSGEHRGDAHAAAFFAALRERAHEYSGFNLLLTDAQTLWYGSNRATPFARELPAGVYGLSNELLDTPWPKLQRVRVGFEAWLHAPGAADPERLFALLADRRPTLPREIAPSATDEPTASNKMHDFAGAPAAGPSDEMAPGCSLPAEESGLPREWQRALSAPFVLHPEYGTRCSTVLLLEPDGAFQLTERRFDPHGDPAGESTFALRAGEWP
jgi:uncharacterized protein with NRDE domain